jgi:hypothetical protein
LLILFLVPCACWSDSVNVLPSSGSTTPSYDWQSVKNNCINNSSTSSARHYAIPNASPENYISDAGLEAGAYFPLWAINKQGMDSKVAEKSLACIQLGQADIQGQTWYRFRLQSAFHRKEPEYTNCVDLKGPSGCRDIETVCEGKFYYVPQGKGGVSPCRDELFK